MLKPKVSLMRLLLKVTIPIFTLIFVLGYGLSSRLREDCYPFLCWDGIMPGITTATDVENLLSFYNRHRDVTYDPSQQHWHDPDAMLAGFLSTNEHHIVDELHVNFGDPYITIADIIANIGEPTSVFLPTYDCDIMFLVYREHGVIASLNNQDPYPEVKPDQTIRSIQFISPLTPIPYYEVGYDSLLDWQGYTDYCEIFNNL